MWQTSIASSTGTSFGVVARYPAAARSVEQSHGTTTRRCPSGSVSAASGQGAPPAATQVRSETCSSPAAVPVRSSGSQPDSACTWATTQAGGSSGQPCEVSSVTRSR